MIGGTPQYPGYPGTRNPVKISTLVGSYWDGKKSLRLFICLPFGGVPFRFYAVIFATSEPRHRRVVRVRRSAGLGASLERRLCG